MQSHQNLFVSENNFEIHKSKRLTLIVDNEIIQCSEKVGFLVLMTEYLQQRSGKWSTVITAGRH